MCSRNQIYPETHDHTMIYAGICNNDCERVEINMCSDTNCGHWNSISSYNPNGCNMRGIRFGTRVNCLECSKCNRRTIDHS